MRTIICLTLLTSMLTLTSLDAQAIRKELDFYVTSTNGCEWHVTGWIDYSLIPPGIDEYEVTVSGPCGTHKFKGLYNPGEGTNGTDIEMHLYDIDSGAEIPLETIDYMDIYYALEEEAFS